MSAEPTEVLDLQQVTPIVPPAKKVVPAAKKASPPPPKRQTKSRTEIKAELEREQQIREEVRAELEAEYKAKLAEQVAPVDTSFEGLDETPYLHIEPGPGEQVIHMVDDGLTVGSRVYMRGEELALNPSEHPWVNYPRAKQVQTLGKHFFAQGPWPYGGYDLTDPNLTPEDKKRLLQATTASDSFG